MCIIFFIVNENAKDDEYKLILASNRDEFYARPALPAGRWSEDEGCIGGRDMEPGREGGTWLAISTKNNTFKFGALLNITGETKVDNVLPRGDIVSNYIKSSISNAQYCQNFVESDKKFNFFNLITIEISDKSTQSMNYCNVDNIARQWPQREALAFGNSLVTEPLQKVQAGKEKFREIVNRSNQSKIELIQKLDDLLCDRERHWPDPELQRRKPEWADLLCSICVKMPKVGYGTRTRTIILVDAKNNVEFHEKTMASPDPDGEWSTTQIQTNF